MCVALLPDLLAPVQYYLNTFFAALYDVLDKHSCIDGYPVLHDASRQGQTLCPGAVCIKLKDNCRLSSKPIIECVLKSSSKYNKYKKAQSWTIRVELASRSGRGVTVSKALYEWLELTFDASGACYNIDWGCSQRVYSVWKGNSYIYNLLYQLLLYTYMRSPYAITHGRDYRRDAGCGLLSPWNVGHALPCIILQFSWDLDVQLSGDEHVIVLLGDLGDGGRGLLSLFRKLYQVRGTPLAHCSCRQYSEYYWRCEAQQHVISYNFGGWWQVVSGLKNAGSKLPASILFDYLLRLWLVHAALGESIEVVERWPSLAVLRFRGGGFRLLDVKLYTASDVVGDLGSLTAAADAIGIDVDKLIEGLRELMHCAAVAINEGGDVLASRLISLLDLLLAGQVDWDQLYSVVRYALGIYSRDSSKKPCRYAVEAFK